MTTPEAASLLPLKGATPATRQSRCRGVCLERHTVSETVYAA
jgi:hypothetical protein